METVGANARCSRCGAPMICYPGNCWCDALPLLASPDPAFACYCPSCLKSATEASGRLQSTASKPNSP
jgi:hypothetical protein